MKFSVLATLVLLSISSIAQDKPVQNQPTQSQPTAGQVLATHFARTYQAGMRYNDYSIAKHALYNILVEYPQNDSILFSLSYLYFQSQNYASAALTAQDVMALNPNHLGAIEVAAISFENLGVKDKALEAYESLFLKTDDVQTLYKMAFLQYETKSYAESRTNADILLNRKEISELKASFNEGDGVEKEYPIKVALLNLKGLIAQAQGDTKNAETFYNQALAISPDFKMAKDNLASLKN